MRYLVDRDYVAFYLKGDTVATRVLSMLTAEERIAISVITYGEIYEGVYFGRDRPEHERGFARFLRLARVLPLSQAIMRRFARIRGELRRSGRIIGDFDILIASTAIQHNLTLVTRNFAHFRRIRDLQLYEP